MGVIESSISDSVSPVGPTQYLATANYVHPDWSVGSPLSSDQYLTLGTSGSLVPRNDISALFTLFTFSLSSGITVPTNAGQLTHDRSGSSKGGIALSKAFNQRFRAESIAAGLASIGAKITYFTLYNEFDPTLISYTDINDWVVNDAQANEKYSTTTFKNTAFPNTDDRFFGVGTETHRAELVGASNIDSDGGSTSNGSGVTAWGFYISLTECLNAKRDEINIITSPYMLASITP